MRIIVDEPKFKELIEERLKLKTPLLIQQMASNVVANVAAEGRRSEQLGAGRLLKMGRWQRTVKNGVVKEGVMSRWDPKVGWVSTSFTTSTGPFRMASFAWERAKKPNSKRADYTNQLANLWAYPTKPYSKRSPFVGQGPRFKQWQEGERRDARYAWSKTESILRQAVPTAVIRTEHKFSEELKKI